MRINMVRWTSRIRQTVSDLGLISAARAYIPFTLDELETLDKAGLEVFNKFREVTGQNIEDWYND